MPAAEREQSSPVTLRQLIAKARARDPNYVPGQTLLVLQADPTELPSSPGPLARDQGIGNLMTLDVPRDAIPAERRLFETFREGRLLGRPPRNPTLRNPLAREQRYLSPGPLGIGVEAAWSRPGGDGAGCYFVDIEQGWIVGHEDFNGLDIRLRYGINANHRVHGANTLGVVVARDNGRGGVGIAHGVERVLLCSEDIGDGIAHTANALLVSLSELVPGDVVLIESQMSRQGSDVPVETDDLVFEMVALATALGVTVVLPVGNGGRGLDEVRSPTSGRLVFDRSQRDSGAILVGAAGAAVPHRRLPFSNYGAAVDCYAWGESVVTTGGDVGNGMLGAYSFDFRGTSAAAAVIAGAALAVQGIARLSSEGALEPRELRSALADPLFGTPSADPSRDRIGVMPDLRRVLESPGLRRRLKNRQSRRERPGVRHLEPPTSRAVG